MANLLPESQFRFLQKLMEFDGTATVTEFGKNWKSYSSGRGGCLRKGFARFDRDAHYRITELGRRVFCELARHPEIGTGPAVGNEFPNGYERT